MTTTTEPKVPSSFWKRIAALFTSKHPARTWVRCDPGGEFPYKEVHYFVDTKTGRRDARVIKKDSGYTAYVRGTSYGDYAEEAQAKAQAERYSRGLPR